MDEREIEAYRRMTAMQKLELVGQFNREADEIALQDIRRRYPQASERELRLRLASRRIDAETMRRAFGWDPDREGY